MSIPFDERDPDDPRWSEHHRQFLREHRARKARERAAAPPDDPPPDPTGCRALMAAWRAATEEGKAEFMVGAGIREKAHEATT